ncbi:hypothetical protein MTR_8g012880 [Medicago truncatula]|uniref:Uncharacterized protein n=1 Tax=Medicago truncatula TaxID=3880 RepID=A0A072TXA2_MEDTR|nr:hypothetical protein MTR_8g012880 [Medicago truncatula]
MKDSNFRSHHQNLRQVLMLWNKDGCVETLRATIVKLEMTLTFGQTIVNPSFLLGGDAGEAK